ncbi:hypothetical protein AB987_1781 [Acinetobacter baumannii]|nr:hypothetical protein AB987_1781 [Acinetobacter baumannii]
MKIISLKKPLQIGLCNKAHSPYAMELADEVIDLEKLLN